MKYLLKISILMITLVIAMVSFTGCSSKKSDKTNSEGEVIGEDISVNTLTFSQQFDDYSSTVLFSYSNGKIATVSTVNNYNNRTLAQAAYDSFVSDSDIYSDVIIDSKTVSYNLTEEGMKDYPDSQDELMTMLGDEGYSCDN